MTEQTESSAPQFDRIILKDELRARVPLSLVTIWREQKAGRFPPFQKLSAKRVGLRQSDLDAWLAGKRDWAA